MNNAYMREYMRNKYKERREEAISLLGGKCSKCNSVDDLEIDHINAEDKSFNLFKSPNMDKEIFLTELNKCQILCKNCHIEKSKHEACKGSTNGQSKLTEEIVKHCRKIYIPRCREYGAAALARKYGVSKVTMLQAITGKFWKHV